MKMVDGSRLRISMVGTSNSEGEEGEIQDSVFILSATQ